MRDLPPEGPGSVVTCMVGFVRKHREGPVFFAKSSYFFAGASLRSSPGGGHFSGIARGKQKREKRDPTP